jgi:L-alanine-DL-glutamate epimerase-like enolase superfamily enzyme
MLVCEKNAIFAKLLKNKTVDKLKLSFSPYNLLLKNPFTIATYSRTSTPVVLTRLEYGGLVGYGEASLPQYLGETQDSAISFLQTLNLSQFSVPLNMDEILLYVDRAGEGHAAAKAAVDIALHDLTGKMAGHSCYSAWGLNRDKTPYTTFTIGIDNEDVLRKKTAEAAASFKILKIKLNGKNDESIIKTVREVTDLPLAVDANQAWTSREKALETLFWLQEMGVVLVEQPMNKNNLDAHAWLTERSPLPVFADESIQRFADLSRIKGAFSGVNVKLMKCTGMAEAKKILDAAPALGFKTMLGCMTETSCAISAAAQLSPIVDFADLDGALLTANDCFDGIDVIGGKICLNGLPGIGALPNSLYPAAVD